MPFDQPLLRPAGATVAEDPLLQPKNTWALSQSVTLVIERVAQDLPQSFAKRLVNRLREPSQMQVARDSKAVIGWNAVFDLVEKFLGRPPGQPQVRVLGRAALKMDFASLELEGPRQLPIFERPESDDADLAQVLAHVPIATDAC